jgi:hypothetical protein
LLFFGTAYTVGTVAAIGVAAEAALEMKRGGEDNIWAVHVEVFVFCLRWSGIVFDVVPGINWIVHSATCTISEDTAKGKAVEERVAAGAVVSG